MSEVKRAEVPVRGTQSFVGVMSAVWGRPSLTALEVAWRSVAGVAFVIVLATALRGLGADRPGWAIDVAPLKGITVFNPVAAVETLSAVVASKLVPVWPMVRWFLVEACVFWLIVAALGRTFVLRRLDPALKAKTVSLLVLSTLRAGLVAAVWGLLFGAIAWAVRTTILRPAAAHGEPNLVLFCAIVIVAALGLYVLWAVFSWPFYLAPLIAMERGVGAVGALRAALSSEDVRGKLIEINLVMNIVKIAVLVLAMVFSASPLPFSSVETQTFLNCWWGGVILLYFVALDYFHVVRAAAYLSLWRGGHVSAPSSSRA